MPIQAVEPRRLYRQIADQLRALIRSSRRRLRSPRHAIDRKIAFSSEDRKAEPPKGNP